MYNDLNVWMNGRVVRWSDATVPLLSHGFSRGSAIFEVFGTHRSPRGTVAFRMDEHLKRLFRSAELLGMEIGYSTSQIMDAVVAMVKMNTIGRGLVKILAYWGEEAVIQLVLESKLDVAVFAIPAIDDLRLDDAKPISACVSKWRKLHPETVPVEAKACANYLNSYLARKDAVRRGYNVGFLLGTDGFLTEGSIESVFIIKSGTLFTPPLGRILSSITRMSIIEIAQAGGIPCCEKAIRLEDVLSAEEMFVCHTGIKILPIEKFEDRTLKAPGPVTIKLMTMMERVFRFSEDRFADWFTLLHAE
jgi:branched-chain amino acid aminotransferase